MGVLPMTHRVTVSRFPVDGKPVHIVSKDLVIYTRAEKCTEKNRKRIMPNSSTST
jgi:hypothetical protein